MPQERRSESQDRRYERSTRYESHETRPRSSRSSGSRRRSRGGSLGFTMMYIVGVIGVSIVLACLGWIAAGDVLALNKEYKEVTVSVTAEDSFNDVVNTLKKDGLIEFKGLFKLFANVTGGKDKVTIGTYALNTEAEISVTIPEGYSLEQIFQLLEDAGVASVRDLEQEAAQHDYAFSFLQDISLGEAGRLEGFLYPDTYQFNTPHNAVYAINKRLVNFDEKYTDDLRQKVADIG